VIDWPLERDLERSFAAAGDTRERIAPFVRHTPLLEADAPGHPRRLLKLESLQHTGSFKIRGAASAISAGSRPRELVAASTGNHGLAVAAIAARLGLPCRVYVPAGAARAKLTRLRAAGVELVECDGDPLNAELAAREAAAQDERALLVAPYNDPHVVLGAATLGLELLDDLAGDPPDALFVAVGGGGLISGTALAVRSRWPDCRIVACLPEASPAMADAVAAGQIVESRVLPTLADATAGNLEPGSITLAICAALVDEFVLVSEAEIAAAMRAALLDHHVAIEGASALALAASLRDPQTPGAGAERARHVVVVGGGNVGSETLLEIL
jgi:threonine dehydratase